MAGLVHDLVVVGFVQPHAVQWMHEVTHRDALGRNLHPHPAMLQVEADR